MRCESCCISTHLSCCLSDTTTYEMWIISSQSGWMNHVSHLRHAWIMSHIRVHRISNVKHEWIAFQISSLTESCLISECIVSYTQKDRRENMDESRLISETWMNHVSYLKHEWITFHIWLYRVVNANRQMRKHEWITCDTWNMNESCFISECIVSYTQNVKCENINEPRPMCETWMNHVWCLKDEGIMFHFRVHRVVHATDQRWKHEWITFHM